MIIQWNIGHLWMTRIKNMLEKQRKQQLYKVKFESYGKYVHHIYKENTYVCGQVQKEL